jgi:hypothetical protein
LPLLITSLEAAQDLFLLNAGRQLVQQCINVDLEQLGKGHDPALKSMDQLSIAYGSSCGPGLGQVAEPAGIWPRIQVSPRHWAEAGKGTGLWQTLQTSCTMVEAIINPRIFPFLAKATSGKTTQFKDYLTTLKRLCYKC